MNAECEYHAPTFDLGQCQSIGGLEAIETIREPHVQAERANGGLSGTKGCEGVMGGTISGSCACHRPMSLTAAPDCITYNEKTNSAPENTWNTMHLQYQQALNHSPVLKHWSATHPGTPPEYVIVHSLHVLKCSDLLEHV